MQLYDWHLAKVLADDRYRYLAWEAEMASYTKRRSKARPKRNVVHSLRRAFAQAGLVFRRAASAGGR